jgi:cytoskeletal protein RodZ
MLKPEYSLFLGKADETIFSGFVSENGVFLIVESEGTPNEAGIAFLNRIKGALLSKTIVHLADFENIITESVRAANLPLSVALSACYLHENIAYLVTLGEGTLYLKREKEFVNIIHGSENASGPISKDDMYVLATKSFTSLFSSDAQLKKIALKNDVFTVVDSIYEEIGEKKDNGITALFLSPLEAPEAQAEVPSQVVTVEEGGDAAVLSVRQKPKFNLSLKVPGGGSKRILTVAVVVIIFGILIWSVILGYHRRTETELSQKVQTAKEKITSDLDQAANIYSNDSTHAVELITDAKTQLKQLQDAVGTQKKEDVDKLSQFIDQREAQITKKEEKTATEFYDLSVDTKNATAQHFVVNGDIAIMPDNSAKTVYILSLSKKSLNKRISSEVSQASLFSYANDLVYMFIKDKGIYTLSDGNKAKKVVDTDKDWGDIVDMQLYNGNIYLLDAGRNEIYKYLANDSGFSSKQSYFKSNVDIRSATSFAIDSAVYISQPDSVLKFNGGLPTDLKTTYPTGSVSVQKVFTSEDLQKVFVWDKDAGTIFILGKTGEYDQQVQSPTMKTATDFAASDTNLYFLSGSKLYTIQL